MTALEKTASAITRESFGEDIRIPKCWNYLNVKYEKTDDPEEITVNSFEYYSSAIRYLAKSKKDFSHDLIIYSMLIRSFSARIHSDSLEMGNFLKSMCLLPLLSQSGYTAVYLLPVFKMSKKNMKGSLPSPYSVKNMMEIDLSLCDERLENITPETQFKAFCEAAHNLGMKVILDFVFRTSSRDNDLIDSHPDWFYWIKQTDEENFRVPDCPQLPYTPVSKKNVSLLYRSRNMNSFANCFAYPPKPGTLPPGDTVKYARERLGITVMPGFADVINDTQPPWTDITFFRYYFDNTEKSLQKFGEAFPPMIAQDGVKCSLFEGKLPNRELFSYIEDVIPFYIKNFSIDGARLDMAHALPEELVKSIMAGAKKLNKNFIFWSEEFDSKKSGELKSRGYTFFTGGLWDVWNREFFRDMEFNKKLLECTGGEIPCLSCVEMPDTPRCVKKLGLTKTVAAVFLSALLPNSVLMVNNGLEFGEVQPMNLGLGSTEKDRYSLPRSHPLNGKLAFFDEFYFNWENRKYINEAIESSIKIRKRFYHIMKNYENYDIKALKASSPLTLIICHNDREGFVAVANRDTEEIRFFLKKAIPRDFVLGECLYGNPNDETLFPNSVMIYEIVKS